MITFKEAQEIIIGLSKSFGTESIALENALGRILTEPIVADRDYPPFNRATMDGYAMQLEDIEKGIVEFKVVENIFAGQVSTIGLNSGQCYKIMTGAAVPESANMVIQRENIIDNGEFIKIHPGNYKPFQQIAKQGEDVKEEECIVSPPVNCTPAVISVLAALGKAAVKIEKLPRVAVFTTGNEIVPVGEPVSSFQIHNSNQYMLCALLQKWGIKPFLCAHIRDDKKELFEMLSKGITGDIIIISGGVSAGDADYVPEILESLGIKKLFHKVAIKPGKPLWCGQVPGGVMVFALPGNPFSGLVTFTLFVETYLSHCFGLANPESVTLPLNGQHVKKSNLDEFFPVAIRNFPLSVFPLSFNGSGDIIAALQADGIAHHPAAVDILSTKTPVHVRMFKK
jgi:molybdopterin molybdotransferase